MPRMTKPVIVTDQEGTDHTDADSGKAMEQERVQYQKLCKRGGNEVVSWVSSPLGSRSCESEEE